jgi:hypothetical protein
MHYELTVSTGGSEHGWAKTTYSISRVVAAEISQSLETFHICKEGVENMILDQERSVLDWEDHHQPELHCARINTMGYRE